MRVLWAAAELALEYRLVPLEFDDPALKEEAFLQLNPAGAVPTIDDGGFALSESLAINLYLAKCYGPPLCPATLQGEASAWRWTLWVQGHLEPWVQRDAQLSALRVASAEHTPAVVQASLAVLERALRARTWLVDDVFSVADLNVAAVLSPSRASHLDFSKYPHVDAWLGRCYARPAAVASRARYC
jgi:glutathione S-transferase